MPQVKPGIATTILAPDATGEGFVEISPNKTLFIQKLTNEEPLRPDIVEGLEKIEDVFAHFQPQVDVELDKEDGSTVKENFKFGGLSDFDLKGLTNQSSHLKNLNFENDSFLKVIKQLKTNKSLKNVVENPETKAAFVNSLKSLIQELDNIE